MVQWPRLGVRGWLGSISELSIRTGFKILLTKAQFLFFSQVVLLSPFILIPRACHPESFFHGISSLFRLFSLFLSGIFLTISRVLNLFFLPLSSIFCSPAIYECSLPFLTQEPFSSSPFPVAPSARHARHSWCIDHDRSPFIFPIWCQKTSCHTKRFFLRLSISISAAAVSVVGISEKAQKV